jgi:hypothetical protein
MTPTPSPERDIAWLRELLADDERQGLVMEADDRARFERLIDRLTNLEVTSEMIEAGAKALADTYNAKAGVTAHGPTPIDGSAARACYLAMLNKGK